MGLDIFFYKRNNELVSNMEMIADTKDKKFWEEEIIDNFFYGQQVSISDEEYDELYPSARYHFIYNNNQSQVACFRKVNFLLPFFGYNENRSELNVSKEQVEELIGECDKELNHEDSIVPINGFWFGNTEKDKWFYKDVKCVKDKFTNILNGTDWNNESIVMWCWW